MLASVVQILGVLCLAAAAFLAWGIAPAVGVVGGGLLTFGVAAELGRLPDKPPDGAA